MTVGHGFDLTEHNIADLKNMGLPKALIERLSPYLGKTSDATDLPKDLLKHSIEDATLISKLALVSIIQAVEKKYEERSGRQFEDLPANVQTVAVDLAYMMGLNGYPRFMDQLAAFDPTKPDHSGMKSELIHFWREDANPDNRNGWQNRTNDDLRISLPPRN